MVDHVVEGGADRFGVALIVEGCGYGVVLRDELVAFFVEFVGCCALDDEGRDVVEAFGTESSGFCHGLEVLGLMDGYGEGAHFTGG